MSVGVKSCLLEKLKSLPRIQKLVSANKNIVTAKVEEMYEIRIFRCQMLIQTYEHNQQLLQVLDSTKHQKIKHLQRIDSIYDDFCDWINYYNETLHQQLIKHPDFNNNIHHQQKYAAFQSLVSHTGSEKESKYNCLICGQFQGIHIYAVVHHIQRMHTGKAIEAIQKHEIKHLSNLPNFKFTEIDNTVTVNNHGCIKLKINGRWECTIQECKQQVFNSKIAAQQHAKIHIHQSERPYICSFKGCKKAFRERNLLQTHKQTHKVFKCTHVGCSAGYNSERWLQKHIKSKHVNSKDNQIKQKRKQKCPLCAKMLANKQTLIQHFKNVHRILSLNKIQQIYAIIDNQECSNAIKQEVPTRKE